MTRQRRCKLVVYFDNIFFMSRGVRGRQILVIDKIEYPAQSLKIAESKTKGTLVSTT